MASLCPHEATYQGLCVVCGEEVGGRARTPVVMGGVDKTLHFSDEALAAIEREYVAKLINDRKLVMILDLDHTVLHASRDLVVLRAFKRWREEQRLLQSGAVSVRLSVETRQKANTLQRVNVRILPVRAKPRSPKDLDFSGPEGVVHVELSRRPRGHRRVKEDYFIKFRPGLQHFMKEASKLFEIQVYTKAMRNYAEAVLNACDPNHKYVKGRVVSGDDLPELKGKLFKRLCPCDPRMVLIIDDRMDVWFSSADNVVQVLPFQFFTGSEVYDRHQPVVPGASPRRREGPRAVSPGLFHTHNDNVLESVLAIATALHRNFYSGDPWRGSVPRTLCSLKSAVLQDCGLVFSGVFPLGQPGGAKAALEWKMAEKLGAVCYEDFTPQNVHLITHVVASRPGTDKIKRAHQLDLSRRPARLWVVKVDWLFCSYGHLVRACETRFELHKQGLAMSICDRGQPLTVEMLLQRLASEEACVNRGKKRQRAEIDCSPVDEVVEGSDLENELEALLMDE